MMHNAENKVLRNKVGKNVKYFNSAPTPGPAMENMEVVPYIHGLNMAPNTLKQLGARISRLAMV